MNVSQGQVESGRFSALDGWRGISILLVLATHLLPLGPKAWQLNATAGPLGMALFFTLSGFLITNFLLNRPAIGEFLLRRFLRIVPLAWLYIIIALLLVEANTSQWLAHLLFYANWPPMSLSAVTSHFWSLCVEMQFYISVALLVAILGRRGLYLLPLLCVAVTAYRIDNGAYVAINTYYRVDEILAGGILALVYHGRFGEVPRNVLAATNPLLILGLLIISAHPESGFINYMRPYLAAMLVGATLYNTTNPLSSVLNSRALFYIATISYALYVIHPLLAYSWLGSGEGWEKYAKRPLLFLVLIALAHISTYHYERKWIAFAKQLTARSAARSVT